MFGWDAPEEAIDAVHDLPGFLCLTAGDWNSGDLSCVAGMTGLEGLKVLGVDPEREEMARAALPEGAELIIS